MSAIFISHSSRDNEAAQRLAARFADHGHPSVFLDFDPALGIPAGRDWEQELYRRLRGALAVVVLCSEHSMASQWVFAEITHAKALGKPLFPLKVGPCEIDPVLTARQIVDLTTDEDEAFARLLRGLEAAGVDATRAWPGGRSPYPGLAAFQERDEAVYFGRGEAIRDVLERLNRLRRFGGPRLLLLLGASGSGKSSLLRAGVLPRLQRDGDRWLVIGPLRPGGDPPRALADALADAFALHGTELSRSDLATTLRRAVSAAPQRNDALDPLVEKLSAAAGQRDVTALLVVDQLEELLGVGEDSDGEHRGAASASDERGAFLGWLKSSLGPRLMAVATLRSDFLGTLQQHPSARDLRFEDLGIGAMARPAMREVIEGPVRVTGTGVELETGLAQRLLDDAEGEDSLPLLAFTLRELWEDSEPRGVLTLAAYHRLGGLEGSVARSAEAVFHAEPLAEDDEDRLRRAFLALVRVTDDGRYARRPASWDDLPAAVHPVLERFVQARLLASRGDGRGRTLEVAHEALLRSWDRLRQWVESDRDFLVWRRRLRVALADWRRAGRSDEARLQSMALREAERWLAERGDDLGDDERALVERSLAVERRRRQRVVRGLAAGVLLALGLAALAGLGFLQARRQQLLTEQQKNAAVAGELAAAAGEAANRGSGSDLELSALLAVESLKRQWTLEGHQRWLEAMQLLPQPRAFLAAEAEDLLALADGRLLARSEPSLTLWDVDAEKEIASFPHTWKQGYLADVLEIPLWALDASGKVLVSADGETLRVWETDLLRQSLSFAMPGPIAGVAISPDGRWLACGAAPGLRVWDRTNGAAAGQVDDFDGDALFSFAVSADGRLLLAGEQHRLRLWQLDPWQEIALETSGDDDRIGGVAAISPDGKWLVDWRGHVWETARGGLVHRLPPSSKHHEVPRFSSTGKQLLYHSQLVSTRWSRPPLEFSYAHHEMSFSPDDRLLIVHRDRLELRTLSAPKRTEATLAHSDTWLTRFSEDGRWLAATNEEGTIRVWDTKPSIKREVARMGFGGGVRALAFDPGGRWLAAAGYGPTRVWNIPARAALETASGDAEDDAGVLPAWKVKKGSGEAIQVLDTSTEKVRFTVAHAPQLTYTILDADERRMATTGRADDEVWDLTTGESHPVRGQPLGFSPDGERLLTVRRSDGDAAEDSEMTFAVVETSTGEETRTWPQSGGRFMEVTFAWSADGRWLATGIGILADSFRTFPDRGWVRVRHTGSWEVAAAVEYEKGPVELALAPDGSRLASVHDGSVELRTLREDGPALRLDHEKVEDVAFGHHGDLLATRGDRVVRLWRASDGELLSTFVAPRGISAWQPEAARPRLAVGTVGGEVLAWSLGEARPILSVRPYGLVERLAWSDDGRWLQARTRDGRYLTWDVDRQRPVELPANARFSFGAGRALEFRDASAPPWTRVTGHWPAWTTASPDGRWLATGGEDRVVVVWDAATGERVALEPHPGVPNVVRFSDDGRWLVSVSSGRLCVRSVAAFAARDGKTAGESFETGGFCFPVSGEVRADFSHNGRYLAVTRDDSVRLWDTEAERELAILVQEDSVNALAFSADDTRLATVGDGGAVSVWETGTGRLLGHHQVTKGERFRVTWSADGARLAVSGDTVAVVDAESGELHARFGRMGEPVFTPDGRLASGSRQRAVYPLDRDTLVEMACARLERNLSWEEWRRHFRDRPYSRTCPGLDVHPSVRKAAKALARAGRPEEAENLYGELYAALGDADPAAAARRAAAPAWVARGRLLARQGKVQEAIELYDKARAADPDLEITPGARNTLCWFGAIHDQAAQVLAFCDEAVAARPENPHYYDSRAVARALLGDREGAIEDFRVYVQGMDDAEPKRAEREAWLEELEAGGDPFTPERLEALRDEL